MRQPPRMWLPILAAAAVAGIGYPSDASAQRWRTASREPVGLAPDPATTPEAVVQVYAARAVRWRGYVGVHTWLATKASGAEQFNVYEVNGWRLRRSGSAVVISSRAPDGRWFGNEPELLADVRGEHVDALIERLTAAADDYPYAGQYRVWPGPNSNTFTAFVLRRVPELRVDLPATAIGKDYLGGQIVAPAPSGTGLQLSVFGLLGLLAAAEEGLEINVLGLTFGLDPLDLSLKVPLAGRISAWWLALVAVILQLHWARNARVRKSRGR